jgi:hypothetical protein
MIEGVSPGANPKEEIVPKLSSCCKTSERVTIGKGKDALHVEFNPAAYTPKFEREVKRLGGDDEDRDVMSAMLAGLLISWDLTDEDEKPIGVDEASLTALPLALLKGVLEAIVAELLPNPTKPAPSGSFS